MIQRHRVTVAIAATGTVFTGSVPVGIQGLIHEWNLVIPDYTTGTPTTTLTLERASGVVAFTDSARAENAKYCIIGSDNQRMIDWNDTLKLTLSDVSGGSHEVHIDLILVV